MGPIFSGRQSPSPPDDVPHPPDNVSGNHELIFKLVPGVVARGPAHYLILCPWIHVTPGVPPTQTPHTRHIGQTTVSRTRRELTAIEKASPNGLWRVSLSGMSDQQARQDDRLYTILQGELNSSRTHIKPKTKQNKTDRQTNKNKTKNNTRGKPSIRDCTYFTFTFICCLHHLGRRGKKETFHPSFSSFVFCSKNKSTAGLLGLSQFQFHQSRVSQERFGVTRVGLHGQRSASVTYSHTIVHPTQPSPTLSGKASTSRAEDPGFESRLRRDFFGVESYQWLKNWHSSGYPDRRLEL